ncbi:tripartite tricarboxylate transporter substrate binding protein [Enterovirga sp.]|jgi:tripartite-type tricarboxylate transporter receptor subunit TctC|uniref:Bug family tripartite tricarboxylate transporter substrate binding protein n=1 Tax=Enterovirga sp. TaxID=2026350 RepID=UPI002603FC52|nr:tripartite tricarboxylate transporter substrate binding protein [Enterovirga sp.]MDB5591582.1 tripartite tricarboxylate transporter family receptor [Enterovirga sp.]
MRPVGRRSFIWRAGASALLAGTGLPLALPAGAQGKWPERPVRLVVPLAPGGAIDFVARQCGEVMTRQLGQQVIVENRTGAGGTIGMDSALRSDPDGYTILIANDNAASAPHILKLPHDYTKVLLPVIDIGHQPLVLGVHPSLGVGSLQEYVAHAKANPGVGFASSGVGSNQHVLGGWLAKETGIRLEHVPYRGAGQAVNDLVAGHVKSALLGPTALIPHHLSGSIKIIAQSGSRRAPTLPDIPTFEDAGYKGLVLDVWYAAFAPPGTPPELIKTMNAAFARSLDDPRLRDAFAKGIVEPIGGTPEQLGELARADSAKYERLVRDLGIKPS